MRRGDLAPVMAGLSIGGVVSAFAFDAPLTVNDMMMFAVAMIYFGMLAMDAVKAFGGKQ